MDMLHPAILAAIDRGNNTAHQSLGILVSRGFSTEKTRKKLKKLKKKT